MMSFSYAEEFSATALLLGVIVLTFTFYIYQKFFNDEKGKLYSLLPGPKPIPFFGNLLMLPVAPEDSFRVMRNLEERYREEGMFLFHVGNHRLVMIYSPETAEVILSNKNLINKSQQYDDLKAWLGTGLVTSTGKKWKSRRRLLTPAFHFLILTDFIEVFNKQSSKLVSKLHQMGDGKSFDLAPFISRCTLDIIHETALGVSADYQDGGNAEYANAIRRVTSIYRTRENQIWAKFDILYYLSGLAKEEKSCIEILHSKSNEVIDAKTKEIQNSKRASSNFKYNEKPKKLAFLDLLMKEEELSKEDIREEVDTFMFAGHDTVSTATWFLLYLLARNPDKQNLVHEELDELFEHSDRPVTTTDLTQLKYMECCIKEGLRVLSPIPNIGRQLNEDVWLNGYLIPNGATIIISIIALHRNEKCFPEANKFLPERFLNEEGKHKHPYAYVPFSAGPRNCLGQKFAMMEAKILLSTILRHFRVTCDVKEEDLNLMGHVVMRTIKPVKMQLHVRK